MGNAFGTKKTLKEQFRENKRMINRAIRDLDRERAGMEKQEKKLVIDIKKAAKEGQMVRTLHPGVQFSTSGVKVGRGT